MARLEALRSEKPGLFARFVQFIARRKLGRTPEPLRVLQRNRALMIGVGAFETALERATLVPARTRSLAELRVALQVGCPF